jgi:site-specific DNA-methyltransferase (adenine-specific)
LLELNRIYNMDCLEGFKLIPDKSVDLVVTDPPYLIKSMNGGGFIKNRPYKKDLDNDLIEGFPESILDELCRVMKKINIYIWCSKEQIAGLLSYFQNKGANIDLLTWHKTNPVPACNNNYLPDTEYIVFAREEGVKIYGTYQTKKKYYITPINSKDKRLYKHPTVKPLNIIENFIINSSLEGEIVLDPFMGSGTTAVACIKTNRNFIGFELDEHYCEIANERIQKTLAEKVVGE